MGIEEPRTLRVIVADDNAEMRLSIMKILRRQSFQVIDVVACGGALVDSALSRMPDVIVSDVSMPVSGLDAMVTLATAGCTAPFVLVSVGTAEALEWMNRGALAVVDKFDLDTELIAAVRSAASGFSYISARARRSTG